MANKKDKKEYSMNEKFKARVFSMLVIAIMTMLLVFNIVKKPTAFSELENRQLAQFVAPTVGNLLSGQFMEDFSSYITDQFAFRDFFVSVKARSEKLMGKKDNNGVIFSEDGYLIQRPEQINKKELDTNISAVAEMARLGRFKVSLAVVPSGYEILRDRLPDNGYKNIYGEMMKYVNAGLEGKGVTVIDTYDSLNAVKDQYVYYKTDHHQTALGSYYTYRDIAMSYGIEPHKLSDYNKKVLSDEFYGTNFSKAPMNKEAKDEIVRYTLKEDAPKFSVKAPGDNYEIDGLFDNEKLLSKDKYSVFLGGNHPLTIIDSDVKNGKKLIIFKDSYAHSIMPFLAAHYESIHLIDLRYFAQDMVQYAMDNKISDILFLYSDASFISGSNLAKLNSVASTYDYIPPAYGRVPKTEPVDASYFADAVFIGDSITKGFKVCTDLPAEFMCSVGIGTYHVLEKPIKEGGYIIIDEATSRTNAGKYYIMLGGNELGMDDKTIYYNRYRKIIQKLKEANPKALIYVQSVLPTSEGSQKTHGLYLEDIQEANAELEKICDEEGCYYLHVYEDIANEQGFLPDDAAPADGMHFDYEYNKIWEEYLLNHAYITRQDTSEKVDKFVLFEEADKEKTKEIAEKIEAEVGFKEKLNGVNDKLLASMYNVTAEDAVGGYVLTSSGATAEEIAVFEVKNSQQAKKLKSKLSDRVENKKRDFENYIPAEMTKLKDPCIAVSDKLVVLCISDNTDKAKKFLEDEYGLKTD